LIIEVNEIAGDIINKKKDYEKEQKKMAARETRKKEMLENMQDEGDKSNLNKTPEIPKAGSKVVE
jgi:hypothetical protein